MAFSLSQLCIKLLLSSCFITFAASETHEQSLRGEVISQRDRKLKSCYEFNDNKSLEDAVWTWFNDEELALIIYGKISCWDVRKVTSMSGLFSFKENGAASSFDEDLSSWDTSRVTNMSQMFRGAKKFNSDISTWNVSKVTNMEYMFWDASSFHARIQHWDTSNVENMRGMFQLAKSFNRCVSEANVFCESKWDIKNVKDMRWMFSGASSFKQSLCWDLKGKKIDSIFRDSKGCIKPNCCKSCDPNLLCY